MASNYRIAADTNYLQSLGRAFYSFTYLEWIVIWTIVKLSADGFGSVPRGQSASHIAKALIRAIAATEPPLPDALRRKLIEFHANYLAAIGRRNKLLHAHPYTAAGGAQQLGGGGLEWPIEAVDEATAFFEEAAVFGNALFHGDLEIERP